MAQQDVVAIAACVIFGDAYLAVEGRIDGVAGIYFHIDAFVDTAESLSIAETAGDLSAGGGHGESPQVDFEAVGECAGVIAMCVLVVPGGIESGSVIAFSLVQNQPL